MSDKELSALMRDAEKAGPSLGSHWRHKGSGHRYVVLSTQPALREADLAPVVLYQRYDPPGAVIWCRPAEEFLDGRFERIE